MRLLLFSNSTNAGENYLNYTLPYIKSFLPASLKHGVFIPFAGISVGFDKYFTLVNSKFEKLNLKLLSLHNIKEKITLINEADYIVVGGGNTFCLLKELQNLNLLDSIRERVKNGIPYIGWSAGSNLTCPTIKTTNDMPIVEPDSFNALHLIPFQINPHYTDFKETDHAGETREMRIEEYLMTNRNQYVTGLREGTFFRIENKEISLIGKNNCRIFKYGQKAIEMKSGEDFQFLMQ